MPFSILPAALGITFFLVWAFIGVMLLRDAQLAAKRDRDCNDQLLPFSAARPKKSTPLRTARMAS